MAQNKRKPFFRFVKRILRLFIKPPRFSDNAQHFEDGAIYICNHVGSTVPLRLELYFPRPFKFWGTYEMTYSCKERWNYLAHNYFYKKKHNSKFMAKVKATLSCPFIGMFYKGMQLIPTYQDARLLTSLTYSVSYLSNKNSIVIFPENSSDGYHDLLREYYAGFLFLAKHFHAKTKQNIKIFNMYYRKEENLFVVDQSYKVEELLNDERDIRIIANEFRIRANQLAKAEV